MQKTTWVERLRSVGGLQGLDMVDDNARYAWLTQIRASATQETFTYSKRRFITQSQPIVVRGCIGCFIPHFALYKLDADLVCEPLPLPPVPWKPNPF